jgi:hypothetical protein
MDTEKKRIQCPNCGQEIDVNEILYHQLEDELKKKFNDELVREKKKYDEQSSALDQQMQELKREKSKVDETIQDGIQQGVKTERQILEVQLRKKVEDEKSEQFRSMQQELNDKSEKLKELNKAKTDIEKLKREKDELRDAIQAESEKKLNEILRIEKEKIQKIESGKMQLKISEKDNVIEQLMKQLQEAQRKAEQGSTQLQGEVQELAIEDWLRTNFPLDTIQEVKKGAKGADCLQIVNTRTRQNCGSIYYESKRTKGFQSSWIEKFKDDIRSNGADIGVLVTEVMPDDMVRMGPKDGIWICTFDEFKGLCTVLRESLIQISTAIATQENKGDKMSMLYEYLTSNEFKLHVEGIVEGFNQMQIDLESEKRAMQSIWKKREKQIQKVLLNTNHMYSSIKGIGGKAIQTVKQLEFSRPERKS